MQKRKKNTHTHTIVLLHTTILKEEEKSNKFVKLKSKPLIMHAT